MCALDGPAAEADAPVRGAPEDRRGGSSLLTREIDLRPLWNRLRERPAGVLIGLGVFLRVWEYLGGRSYWLDEGSLLGNLTGGAVFDFSAPFRGDQLAPFGFVVIERCMARIFGGSPYSMRLFPLLCGIAAVVLFARLARRAVAPRAALVALALFSLSSDLIYYSAELKQYSTDLAVSLLVILAALAALQDGAPLDWKSAGRLAALAVAAPWLSFASSFATAGAGGVLLIDRIRRRRFRETAAVAAIAVVWAVGFGLCHRATRSMLNQYTTMYIFWDFAFLPFPPTDWESLRKFGGILLDVLVNPLNMVPPQAPAVGAAPAVVALALGAWSLWRRDRGVFGLLAAPIALAVAASGLRRFPFHGRLILELTPAFFLLIAEGADWFQRRVPNRPRLHAAALVLLLAHPIASGLLDGLSRGPRVFDSHGDLRRNLFLYEPKRPGAAAPAPASPPSGSPAPPPTDLKASES